MNIVFPQVLLSPPIVVYSPRVLPVYVYDAHADCGKNVRFVLKAYLLIHSTLIVLFYSIPHFLSIRQQCCFYRPVWDRVSN